VVEKGATFSSLKDVQDKVKKLNLYIGRIQSKRKIYLEALKKEREGSEEQKKLLQKGLKILNLTSDSKNA